LSQSHAAKKASSDDHSVDLSKLDLLYAFLLHALVLIIVLVVAFWQGNKQEEPLQRIEVMMISAKQLSTIEQQSRRKVKQVKKAVAKPKVIAKPKPKVNPKLEPVLKLEEKAKHVVKAEPKVVAKPAPKAVPKKVEDDFDSIRANRLDKGP